MNADTPYLVGAVGEVLFWGSLGAIVYSYFVYPFIVALLVKTRGTRLTTSDEAFRPTVSMVISLYNEEGVLPEKLRNLKEIDYPQDRIEFVFGSDGSTDSTNELLTGWDHAGKKVFVFDHRRGKAPVLNDLIAEATGEIVVLSDANTVYRPDTIGHLVRRLADPAVGGVCGELVLVPDDQEPGGVGERSYWSYENWLKKLESEYRTLLGATGGVYAIRRRLFVPLPTHKSVTDDFLIPLKIVMQGFRVIYARDALAYERTSGSMKGEFRRKARIGAQNFSGIVDFAPLLGPRAGFVAFALWSHKIIRWCVPFLAILVLCASLILAGSSPLYDAIVVGEAVFLAVAVAGFIAERTGVPIGVAGLPYYILAMNTALLVGFFRFMSGSQRTTWDVLR